MRSMIHDPWTHATFPTTRGLVHGFWGPMLMVVLVVLVAWVWGVGSNTHAL